MVSPVSYLKAEAFRAWIKTIIGEKPDQYVYDDYIEISFNDQQANELRKYFQDQINRSVMPANDEPPEVQIKWNNVILPLSLSYILPAAMLLIGTGYIIGKQK